MLSFPSHSDTKLADKIFVKIFHFLEYFKCFTFWHSLHSFCECLLFLYSPRYQFFRPFLEGTPHPLPHVCLGGSDLGDMATLYSPNDPVFFLHHSFVDLIYALWQDCYDYDGEVVESRSNEYDESVMYLLRFDFLPGILSSKICDMRRVIGV